MQLIEHCKASIRAKVEHPFHATKNQFAHRKARYRGMEKNHTKLFSLYALTNLVLAKRCFATTDEFIAS